MHDVGMIWQYSDCQDNFQKPNNQMIKQDKNKLDDLPQGNYPLLGRKVELMIVTAQIMLMDEPSNKPNRRKDLAAIIFEG